MENGKVSIIVPVYNVEAYLDRCVASLVEQTYDNIEIILVDDGATDSSGQMCDLWQERDERIRAVHKTNGGLSDARNCGLGYATGEYVCFVDSDDWVEQRYVSVLLAALQETGADLAECDVITTDGTVSLPVKEENRQEIFDQPDCYYQFITENLKVVVWNKIYRRELLENEPFRVGVYHEDVFWTYRIMGKASRVCKTYFKGYFYYQRPGSIMNSKLTKKHIIDRLTGKTEMMAYTERFFSQFRSLVCRRHADYCGYLYHSVMQSSIEDKKSLEKTVLNSAEAAFGKCSKADMSAGDWYRLSLFARCPQLYCRLFYGFYCRYIVPRKQKRTSGDK